MLNEIRKLTKFVLTNYGLIPKSFFNDKDKFDKEFAHISVNERLKYIGKNMHISFFTLHRLYRQIRKNIDSDFKAMQNLEQNLGFDNWIRLNKK